MYHCNHDNNVFCRSLIKTIKLFLCYDYCAIFRAVVKITTVESKTSPRPGLTESKSKLGTIEWKRTEIPMASKKNKPKKPQGHDCKYMNKVPTTWKSFRNHENVQRTLFTLQGDKDSVGSYWNTNTSGLLRSMKQDSSFIILPFDILVKPVNVNSFVKAQTAYSVHHNGIQQNNRVVVWSVTDD